ncbi:MAG: globin family protein [Methylophilaceae bacterium]
MTPHQISLVNKTWSMTQPLGDAVTILFYGRLFELDPSLRTLFKMDFQEQGHRLRAMLALVTTGLNQPEKLAPVLAASGQRHVHYGVLDSHYDSAGEALIWALAQCLREIFTPEVREAWIEAYELMARLMKEGAAQPA